MNSEHVTFKIEANIFSVPGNFSNWSEWSECRLMENQTWAQIRSRDCTNPRPANGAQNCSGSFHDTRSDLCVQGENLNHDIKNITVIKDYLKVDVIDIGFCYKEALKVLRQNTNAFFPISR